MKMSELISQPNFHTSTGCTSIGASMGQTSWVPQNWWEICSLHSYVNQTFSITEVMQNTKTDWPAAWVFSCFYVICSVTSHKQLSNKEHWRNNQLINHANTNKNLLERWFTVSDWFTNCEYIYIYISVFFYFYFVGCADIKWPTNKLNIYFVERFFVSDRLKIWLSDSSSQDNHVCSLSCRVTSSVSLPLAFVCRLHHPMCQLFSSTE